MKIQNAGASGPNAKITDLVKIFGRRWPAPESRLKLTVLL